MRSPDQVIFIINDQTHLGYLAQNFGWNQEMGPYETSYGLGAL